MCCMLFLPSHTSTTWFIVQPSLTRFVSKIDRNKIGTLDGIRDVRVVLQFQDLVLFDFCSFQVFAFENKCQYAHLHKFIHYLTYIEPCGTLNFKKLRSL